MSEKLKAALLERAKREKARRAGRNPDGTYGQPPKGTVMNEAGQMVTPELQQAKDQRILAAHPVASRAVEVVQGLPLVGEWLDEGLEKVAPESATRMREMSGAMEREHPTQSALLNIGGGVLAAAPAAAIGAGAKGLDWISKGSNVFTRGMRAGAVAAPAAALEGASAFSGRADDGERLSAAGQGAFVGGGLGLALGPIASSLGEGAASLAKRFKKLDVRTIADEFGISAPAARTVKQAIENDDWAQVQARLSQLGDDAMLADAGQGTAALLDAAANSGGKALRVSREAVDQRAANVGRRLPRVLDGIFGKTKGVRTAAREIAQETSPARTAAYDAAYSKPINYADDTGRQIESTLARIPPKTLDQAVQEANEAMIADGLQNKQIMAKIGDDGGVVFQEMPNVQQLDFLKRALDDVSRKNVDQFGRPTAAGVRARKLAGDLRDAVKSAVPEYARALRIGGDKIQRDEGLDLGRRLLFRNTTVEDVEGFLRQGVSNEARQAVRQGVRDSIEQTLSNVRRTISDPDTDAREAMQLVKDLSSRANRDKLKLVLGGVRADRLLQELDKSAAALSLKAAIAQNSKTAIRQSIQDQVASETTPGIFRRAAGNLGNPLDAAKEVSRTVAGIDPQNISAQQKQVLDEIAQALVGIRGDGAQQALAAVLGAMRGQPIKDAQASLIGRLVAGSTAVGGLQAGKRTLESQ